MKQNIGYCHSSDGTRIAYATAGEGAPFVKAANYMSHIEHDWHSPVWRHWLRTLSARHTFVRYDTRGCGLSDWELRNLGIEAWVSDLEAVVDALQLERFPLLGVSQGGAVAVEYARRYPQKVSHLILYGAYSKGRLKRDLSSREFEEAQGLLKLIEYGWGQDTPAFRNVFTTLFMPGGSPEQIEWFNELQRVTTSPQNASQLEEAFFRIDVSGSLPEVNVPTLVMHARRDAMVAFAEGEQLAKTIPGARFLALAGENHILLEVEPAWGQFLAALYTFLGMPEAAPADRPDSSARIGIGSLTNREREVLELLARGMRNAEIANHLFLTPKTVRNYLSNIFGKLNVEDRGEAIVVARGRGFGKHE